MNLNDLAAGVHATAIEKGWYDTERGFPELIALMHSELSEALESFRDQGIEKDMRWDGSKPVGIGIELADTIIRILDACAFYGIDIQKALDAKMAYNKTRPYRHGNKRA